MTSSLETASSLASHTHIQKRLDNTAFGLLLAEELYRLGVSCVAIASGSRSTPLVAGLVRHPHLRTELFHDERSAGFFALGVGRATQKPAVIVTTSGTAVANLYPAVVEASISQVPVLILSADRPPESQRTDANQTIDQHAIFGKYPRLFTSLPPPEDIPHPFFLLRVLDEAIAASLGKTAQTQAGPVHVNCMLRKPLEPTALTLDDVVARFADLSFWFSAKTPLITHSSHAPAPQAQQYTHEMLPILDDLRRIKNGCIVVGECSTDADRADAQAAIKLGSQLGWPVLVDILSGLPALSLDHTQEHAAHVLHSTSLLYKTKIMQRALQDHPLDGILWIGGTVTSNELHEIVKQAPFLLRLNPRHWPASEYAGYTKNYAVSAQSVSSVSDVVSAIDSSRSPSALCQFLMEKHTALHQIVRQWWAKYNEDQALLSEVAAYMALCDDVQRKQHALFIGNSMAIRDVDLWGAPFLQSSQNISIYANRGASGIDGLISTAAGIAVGLTNTPTRTMGVTALLGDLSFLHDAGSLSALLHLRNLQIPLRIVVVDNRGGGIFDFLPIHQHEDIHQRWFTASHTVDLAALCRAYGVPVTEIRNFAELRRYLAEATEIHGMHGLSVVVLHCPPAGMPAQDAPSSNVATHRALYAYVQEHMQARGL